MNYLSLCVEAKVPNTGLIVQIIGSFRARFIVEFETKQVKENEIKAGE